MASVQPLGQERLFDITTGTGDFVAEGVVSHNCFARNTHTYLDLDAGADFDSQIVVKVNVARVLERELRSPRWAREPVAMGTNTDPYQRAEGRYRLMPGVIGALARSGTPFSLLTKGTVLTRDLPELAAAAARRAGAARGVDRPARPRAAGPAGAGHPHTGRPARAGAADHRGRPAVRGDGRAGAARCSPTPRRPLDALLDRIAAAGADAATVLALHLRPGTREWFLAWLAREHPGLVEPYASALPARRLRRPGVPAALASGWRRCCAGTACDRRRSTMLHDPIAGPGGGRRPDPPMGAGPSSGEQLSLL